MKGNGLGIEVMHLCSYTLNTGSNVFNVRISHVLTLNTFLKLCFYPVSEILIVLLIVVYLQENSAKNLSKKSSYKLIAYH